MNCTAASVRVDVQSRVVMVCKGEGEGGMVNWEGERREEWRAGKWQMPD